MIQNNARSITLPARHPKYDLHLVENAVHFGTAGAAVHMVDRVTQEYRESTLADLLDAALLVQRLGNVHFFQRPIVARARPFVLNTNCFVLLSMKFAEEGCVAMEACARAGMPVLLLSAGQAGATAPASAATAIVQAMAECLACVVYVNAINPGHLAVFGT